MSGKFDKVLLVDDDSINNFLSEEIISGANITEEVVLLTDGQQALNYLNSLKDEKEPRQKLLILLDLNMPVMDGFEFLEEFNPDEIEADFQIVILTSSDNQRDIEKIKAYDIKNFISKPITEEKLLEILG